jgi:hypothetical protein
MIIGVLEKENNHIHSLYLDWNGPNPTYQAFTKDTVRLRFLSLRNNELA